MKTKILNEVFAEFCESQTHLDSLLSKVNPSQKSRVALLLGAFLRRPLTLANHFQILLGETPEEFWSLGFIRLKKNPGIHAILNEMWEHWQTIPREGARIDFPSALISSWDQDWNPETTDRFCRLLSQEPLTTLRFHRRAYDEKGVLKPEVAQWLSTDSLPKSRVGNFMESARVFRGYATVQRNELYHQGYFEIQDEGSQLMSAFSLAPESVSRYLSDRPLSEKRVLGPENGFSVKERVSPKTVIDACAGAGGKTLALADLMAGRGRVFAYDIYEKKIRGLKQRLERAGENNIKAVVIPTDQPDFLDGYRNSADVVLVDSPCSGYGVLRRNPDIKWNRKPLELKKRENDRPLTEIQRDVLSGYSSLVRPGGRVVYGVCTFNRAETVSVVESFLGSHPDFRLEAMGFVGPYDTDGFFMAALKRDSK